MKLFERILGILMIFLVVSYFYFEIPFFGILFSFVALALIINNRILEKKYHEKFQTIQYDIRLRQVNQDDLIKKVLSYIFSVVLIFLPYFFDFNIQPRELPENSYLCFLVLVILGIYVGFSGSDKRFYYFTNDFIVEPGYELNKIPWKIVAGMDISTDNNKFWLNLRDGKTIKFDMDKYYTGLRNEDILNYVRNRIPVDEQLFAQ